VFASYVTPAGHAFIDRALYLPKSWTNDPDRLAKAHVPEAVKFATKPSLARQMIEHAVTRRLPFSWVAADSVYGVGEIELALRKAGKGYVLGVHSNHSFMSWGKARAVSGTASDIAAQLEASAWQRLSAGDGTKGDRLHDWAYIELADLDANDFGADFTGTWTRGSEPQGLDGCLSCAGGWLCDLYQVRAGHGRRFHLHVVQGEVTWYRSKPHGCIL
jgi:SRSO17 transposase